jgi:predicted Zn-dependent protease
VRPCADRTSSRALLRATGAHALDDFFHQLGRRTGRGLRRGRWLLSSLAGSTAQAIAAEYEAGRDLARSYEAGVRVDEDPRSVALVAGISERLTGRLKNKQRRWRVLTIRDPDPGAFALPGGFLYLTNGLLELCSQDEAEIAWVLGHEMGHVVHGHAAERLAGEVLGSLAARAALSPTGALGQWMMTTGVKVVTRAYSRDQELEADEFGARLAAAAGFQAQAALRVCERLQHFEARSDQPLSEYFASHPPLAIRAKRLDAWLEAQRSG